MHGQNIHLIVVTERGFLPDTFPQCPVVNNMVAAHQPRQIEGLGGRIESNGVLVGIAADTLGRDMAVSLQNEVGPDLIADHFDIIFFKNGKGPFQFLPVPDTAAGIMRRTENRSMDMMIADLLLHVVKIHPPVSLTGRCLLIEQGAVHDPVAVVAQCIGKTDIGRCVDQDVVAAGAEDIEGADDSPQHTVLISDTFRYKIFYCFLAVAVAVPADD